MRIFHIYIYICVELLVNSNDCRNKSNVTYYQISVDTVLYLGFTGSSYLGSLYRLSICITATVDIHVAGCLGPIISSSRYLRSCKF